MSDRRPSEWTKSRLDAWAQPHLPSGPVVALTQAEIDHFKSFKSDYGRFAGLFEVEFTSLVSLIDEANFVDKSAWPSHRPLQFILVAYNLRSLYSAFDRLARGYYEDSITLARTLYETFVRILFASCYPDDAYNTLMRKPPPGTKPFNLTNFVRDDLGLQWESTYGVMSGFAHSNAIGTLEAAKRATEGSGEPERFGLRLKFDAQRCELAIPLLQFVLLALLRFCVERLVGSSELRDRAVMQTASESVEILMYGLKTHPKEYWQAVASDLDRLFQMLVVADSRGDWKTYLGQHDGRSA